MPIPPTTVGDGGVPWSTGWAHICPTKLKLSLGETPDLEKNGHFFGQLGRQERTSGLLAEISTTDFHFLNRTNKP